MRVPFRGTLLNALLVALGALIGATVGTSLGQSYQEIVLHSMGLVTSLLAIRMAMEAKSMIVVAVAVSCGAIVGQALGIHHAMEGFAEWARAQVGGGSTFTETLITTSILYCVGPMTLLGCIEDALENKIPILTMKSIMDGITAIFFSVSAKGALFITALVVLVFQSLLTAGARYLKPLTADPDLLHSITGTGGVLLLATGLRLMDVAKIPTETLLPALVFAPLFTIVERKLKPTDTVAD